MNQWSQLASHTYTHTHTHVSHTHTHTHTLLSRTNELDLSLVVAAHDGVRARRLAEVEPGVQRLHLGYLQIHLVVPEPHHRDVAGRHALAERRVGVAGVEGGDDLQPRGARLPGHHPLEILPYGERSWPTGRIVYHIFVRVPIESIATHSYSGWNLKFALNIKGFISH